MVLGPYLKYSSGLWPEPNTTLKESEETMLELYTKRAQLKDGKAFPMSTWFDSRGASYDPLCVKQ